MSSPAFADIGLSEYEKRVRDHGLLAAIAFLVLIPVGVLIPRYLRTFTNRLVLTPAAHPEAPCESTLTHLYCRWWWGHWITNFLISGPLVFAAWAMGHKAHELTDSPMDHHKVRPPKRIYLRVPTPQHLLYYGSRTLTLPRYTENRLCHLWPVYRTGGPRGVHSLRSHSIPFPRPSTSPELHPCTPGSDYPCNGKLPGSFLLALPPPSRTLLTRIGNRSTMASTSNGPS